MKKGNIFQSQSKLILRFPRLSKISDISKNHQLSKKSFLHLKSILKSMSNSSIYQISSNGFSKSLIASTFRCSDL